jgi:hypothetical protein
MTFQQARVVPRTTFAAGEQGRLKTSGLEGSASSHLTRPETRSAQRSVFQKKLPMVNSKTEWSS